MIFIKIKKMKIISLNEYLQIIIVIINLKFIIFQKLKNSKTQKLKNSKTQKTQKLMIIKSILNAIN